MSEIITIAGPDEATVNARYEIEKNARPNLTPRVLRRDTFEQASLRVLQQGGVTGNDGQAFRLPSGTVYTLVVEFR